MLKPDYDGAGIVNLMASLLGAMGGEATGYPPLAALPEARLRGFRNLVLLVIDGLGHGYLSARRAGFLRERLTARISSVYPPTTASAIPTFLTGVAPQQHGLTGWFGYFRELGGVLAVLPFRPRAGGGPLGEYGIDPRSVCGVPTIFERVDVRSFTVAPEWIAFSDFNRAFCTGSEIRPFRNLEQMLDTVRACVAGPTERSYVYAYWPELDRLAHQHGIGSSPVAVHFEALDLALGGLAQSLKGTDTCLIVTADHGFIDTGPERAILLDDHPRLAETLLLPLCGEPRTAYCYVEPERRRQFEDYAGGPLGHCASLLAREAFLAQGFLGRGAPHPRLWERVGHYVLMMRDDYMIKDWILGEAHYTHYGVHGGLSEAELFVPLIVVEA